MLSGSSKYVVAQSHGLEVTNLLPGEHRWLSDAVLWMSWAHAGQLITESQCSVVELNSHFFRHALTSSAEVLLFRCLKSFAILYVGYAEGRDDVTDLSIPLSTTLDLAARAKNFQSVFTRRSLMGQSY
eukprot:TRINITY_DN66241_c0_g1_i1.p1 TRINITY_DN66241_c0_g1~~TRINITY_DN66241_c0_g1_i1.p1  ORF type:complete len:128 (+),score=16.06 TRINITY_DN66241_c0_g1_i1:2-385(+)